MTRLPALIYTLGLIASVYIACDFRSRDLAAHEHAETVRAAHYEKTAQWNASTARFEAIKAHVELESKRTTTETNIKRVVMNEYKRCRKGKC